MTTMRRRLAMLLRERGFKYREIAERLKVSGARARELVRLGLADTTTDS